MGKVCRDIKIMKVILLASILMFVGCASSLNKNTYEDSTPTQIANYKKVRLPFLKNTKFVISQGAFGTKSHMERGNEYSWDFDVPYGTPVVSVESGVVLEVWEPNNGGACDKKFSDAANNIKIEHTDGSVAQYVHVSSKVKWGEHVNEGRQIAVTAMNGWICSPQLHFGIYKSKAHLYSTTQRETIPVVFIGLPNFGKATEGIEGVVPDGL